MENLIFVQRIIFASDLHKLLNKALFTSKIVKYALKISMWKCFWNIV